jgi:hypothetical protein
MLPFPSLKFLIVHSPRLDRRARHFVENPFASARIWSRYFGSTTLSYSREVSSAGSRSSAVAASRRYVGKETDRRWEQGEDLSLVQFTSFEYQQSKQVVASDEIKQGILKTGIRELERETGVSHHTIERILRGESVRRKTLAKIVRKVELQVAENTTT